MIKKIPVDQLTIGMYVHDLNCGGWFNHPFMKSQFEIEDAAMLRKIHDARISELYIDTDLGTDVVITSAIEDEPDEEAVVMVSDIEGEPDVSGEPLSEISSCAPFIILPSTHAEEVAHAKELFAGTNKLVQGMMSDIRLGKQVDLEQCEPLVENIVNSIFRFPSALLPLVQVKTRDEYTFQHSVAVSALSVSFGRVLDLPRNEIKELAIGGLLHDVGKALVPGKILNKPGKLSDDEFAVMKNHVSLSVELLSKNGGISEIALNAAAQHHERYDGSGYPNGLKGEQISLHGQMLAIVDVYDAITSLRVYHKGMPATEALRKIYEWSNFHFNPRLVQAFIKGVGIYPAGSLVRMESKRLGVVREVVPDKLLQPVVLIIYDCKKECYTNPEPVDLSASNDRIATHESFEKWGIDQSKWL